MTWKTIREIRGELLIIRVNLHPFAVKKFERKKSGNAALGRDKTKLTKPVALSHET